MAGHSKWAGIKHKKAVIDARRGKLFTKLLREVMVAARLGGADPTGNPRLRAAIDDAKASSVPKENIDRAVKKGAGELEGESYEEAVLEGYAPGGVAVLVETLTDNRNRTVGELRHLFSKHGGSLGEAGCVAWMFDRRGVILIPRDAMDEEAFVDLAVELGAEDANASDDGYELLTSLEGYLPAVEELERRAIRPELQQLAMIPRTTVEVDENDAGALSRLLDLIDEQDDVQKVWSNADFVATAAEIGSPEA